MLTAAVSKVRRQAIMPFFSPRALNNFFDIFCEESVKLTEILTPHAGSGPFSVMQYLNEWSFDTIISMYMFFQFFLFFYNYSKKRDIVLAINFKIIIYDNNVKRLYNFIM